MKFSKHGKTSMVLEMVTVMASGVFDLIHTGHISYLEQAKAAGDRLVVVVACDDTVRKRKHEPVTPERMRLRIVESLKPVDSAVIGRNDGDFLSILEEIKPDIIMLGYDQTFDENSLKKDIAQRGYNIEIRRADECSDDLNGTRKIVKKIIESQVVP